jgi:hypothetical protein
MALSDDVTPAPESSNETQPSKADQASKVPARPGWASDSRRDRPHLRRDPLRVYATRAVIWDVVAVSAAAAIGFILRWTIPYNLNISDSTYVFFAGVVVLSWISVLILRGAYDTRVLGVGSEEFKRIVGASAMVFAAIAVVSFALKLDLSRGFVLITFASACCYCSPSGGCCAPAASRTDVRALPAPHDRDRSIAQEKSWTY